MKFLIFGLGNPGKNFRETWHNLGALILEKFAKKYQFPKFKRNPNLKAKITTKKFGESFLILAIPNTFMNESGKAVKLALDFFKTSPKNLLVLHDEIDVNLGKFKFVFNRGDAGHLGVRSIIKEIKTKEFYRIRIGILPKEGKPEKLGEFVLKKIDQESKKELKKIENEIFKTIFNFCQNKPASGSYGTVSDVHPVP